MRRPPTDARDRLDLTVAAAVVAAAAAGTARPTTIPPGSTAEDQAPHSASDLLNALMVLRQMQAELIAIEPALIAAARDAGVSWQALAPALGVASRQAAERRFLRLAPAIDGEEGTKEGRVRAIRDRRAGARAVDRWANANTADLRRLAGHITTLTDLDPDATTDIDRLHQALADPDATALPGLLAAARPHLHAHPRLTDQIDAIGDHTRQIRSEIASRRSGGGTTMSDSTP